MQPNKAFQISALKRIFMRLNPTADPEVIDWDAYVDEKLRIPENREKLARAYPGFVWYKAPEEKPQSEELEKSVSWLEYVIETSVAPEDKEDAFKILDELKRRASKVEELSRKVQELKKRVEKPPPKVEIPPPKPTIPPEICPEPRFKKGFYLVHPKLGLVVVKDMFYRDGRWIYRVDKA
jgi:hypothetical protein